MSNYICRITDLRGHPLKALTVLLKVMIMEIKLYYDNTRMTIYLQLQYYH